MAGELVFPGQPPIIGGGRILPSPAQFFLTGEERIRIVSANAKTGVAVKLQARIANPKGETVPQSWDHTPNTDRSVTREDFEVGIGSLLNVTVFASAGSPQIGQTYVMVQLVRGFGAAAIVLGTILAGNITSVQALGFPGSPIVSSIDGGGYIRTIVGTQPGFGAEVSEVCPTGARWDLLMVQLALTTAAPAGARRPILEWISGGQQVGASANVSDTPPASGGTYNWAQGMPLATQVYAGVNVAGLPHPLPLLAGDFFLTLTANMNAGDRYAAPVFEVREWLEVP